MAAVRALRLKLGLTLAQSCSVLTHDEWIVCVAHTKNRESIEPSAAAVFTATVASVMRGVHVAALLQSSKAAAVARPAACPYAPLDNSYSYAMGVLCCAWRAIWRAKLQVCCCCSKQPSHSSD